MSSTVRQMFPRIERSPGRAAGPFFGGNQQWYPRHTQRYAGCGPVAAANMLVVLARRQSIPPVLGMDFAPTPLPKERFLRLMEQAYLAMGSRELPLASPLLDRRHQRLGGILAGEDALAKERARRAAESPLSKLPASFGNSANTFLRGMHTLCAHYGIEVETRLLKTFGASPKNAAAFVRAALEEGLPLALLTRFNRHPITLYPGGPGGPPLYSRLEAPHFVTVADILGDRRGPNQRLLVSTWGMAATVDLGALARSWQSPAAMGSALLAFAPAK